MQKKWTILVLAVALMAIFSLAACTKKKISSEAARPTTAGAEDETRRRAEEEARQQALKEETLREERLRAEQAQKRTERSVFENEDIYFEFDSIRLSPEAQEILAQKAAWLRMNPRARVTIEGHCDNRGTNEYNLALGEGRAQSAQAFLVDLGIEASRMTTLSYGEERPIALGQDEESWARNRRAHFVIEE